MVRSLPDGSEEIIKLLNSFGELPSDEICDMLDLERKKIQYVIRRLSELGIIESIPNMDDMRKVKYRLKSIEEMEEGHQIIKEVLKEEI